jgi:hypothetical protein
MVGTPPSACPKFPDGRTIASLPELRQAGWTATTLARRVDAGKIIKVDGMWGLYSLPGRVPHAEEDLIRVALRCPDGVVCLLTAMRLNGFDAPPSGDVWIAVRSGARARSNKRLPIRTVLMANKALEYGVAPLPVGEITVPVTSPAKTVADAFKFRNQIGTHAATGALRSCLELGKASSEEIWAAAEVVRVRRSIAPLLEAFG